jgi:hypothetical protein
LSTLAAIALGVLGAVYAAWPALRFRNLPTMEDELPTGYSAADAEAEAAILWKWSAAAGELPSGAPDAGRAE